MSHQDIKPRSAQSIVLSTYTLHSAENQHFGYTKMSQPTEKTGIRSANNRRCWCKQWRVRPQEQRPDLMSLWKGTVCAMPCLWVGSVQQNNIHTAREAKGNCHQQDILLTQMTCTLSNSEGQTPTRVWLLYQLLRRESLSLWNPPPHSKRVLCHECLFLEDSIQFSSLSS